MTIVISGNYSLNSFREDLQKMYKRAGLKGEGLLFLFTDSQVVDERMLVYVNDLLASGEIPDLFAQVRVWHVAVRCCTCLCSLLDAHSSAFGLDRVLLACRTQAYHRCCHMYIDQLLSSVYASASAGGS